MSSYSPLALHAPHETERLRVLHQYQVADAEPEPVFDCLANIAADLFDQPIGLLSLVDADTVYFKANVGLPGMRTLSREQSLCSAAVLETEALVLHDLERDWCRLIDPAVAQEAGLRFYAGIPLTMPEGQNIGTFCVIGREPQPAFAAADVRLFRRLTSLVVLLLELRRSCLISPDADSWQHTQERLMRHLEFVRKLVGHLRRQYASHPRPVAIRASATPWFDSLEISIRHQLEGQF